MAFLAHAYSVTVAGAKVLTGQEGNSNQGGVSMS